MIFNRFAFQAACAGEWGSGAGSRREESSPGTLQGSSSDTLHTISDIWSCPAGSGCFSDTNIRASNSYLMQGSHLESPSVIQMAHRSLTNYHEISPLFATLSSLCLLTNNALRSSHSSLCGPLVSSHLLRCKYEQVRAIAIFYLEPRKHQLKPYNRQRRAQLPSRLPETVSLALDQPLLQFFLYHWYLPLTIFEILHYVATSSQSTLATVRFHYDPVCSP